MGNEQVMRALQSRIAKRTNSIRILEEYIHVCHFRYKQFRGADSLTEWKSCTAHDVIIDQSFVLNLANKINELRTLVEQQKLDKKIYSSMVRYARNLKAAQHNLWELVKALNDDLK